MSEAVEELREAATAAALGTPYKVLPTDDGFDLRIDLVDGRWHGLLKTVGRKTVVQNHVQLDPDTLTMRITDDHFTVRWAAGVTGPVPQLVAGFEATRTLGRTWSVSREWTFGGNGGREVVERRFTTAEAHGLIRGVAAELGWVEKAGVYERIGLVAAVVGGALALVVVLLLIFG